MVQIMTPKGVLLEVVNAVPVCEVRLEFNGCNRRLVEAAKGLGTEPTAIAMKYNRRSRNGADDGTDELFVGNLKPEVVRETMRKLLEDGYFDFSSMGYQNPVEEVKDTVFDNGESLPYTTDFVLCWFATGLFPSPDNNNPFRHPDIFDVQSGLYPRWENLGRVGAEYEEECEAE